MTGPVRGGGLDLGEVLMEKHSLFFTTGSVAGAYSRKLGILVFFFSSILEVKDDDVRLINASKVTAWE